MSREMVTVRHKDVEKTAVVPRTALKHMPGWQVVPADGATSSTGDDTTTAAYTGPEWKKADLEDEVERRNNTRPADEHIAVEGNGTVEDLRTALLTDDAS